MALPKPRTKWQVFCRSTAPYDIASALSGGGTAAASAARFFFGTPPLLWWGVLAAAGASGALVAQLLKAKNGVAREIAAAQDALVGLTGCLHTLNAVVGAGQQDHGFRSTVHAIDGDALVQCVDYVGDQRKRETFGRRTPIHCGVIGKAYREKAMLAGSRETDSYADFIRQMIQVYGFDADRARALDPMTQSWIAAPLIQNGNDVEGVLYCDSTQPGFFTEERQRAIGYAAVGIAFFVGKAYPD
jgi:hypothetical protein